MPIELKMPALSPTMEEGTLAKWLVKVGDAVKSGDVLAEIETDKATMEFEAVDEGTVAEILVPEGTDSVKVGAVIARLASDDDARALPGSADAEPVPPASGGDVNVGANSTSTPPTAETGRVSSQGGREQDLAAERGYGAQPASDPKESEVRSDAPSPTPAASALPVSGSGEERIKASPLARRIAAERGIDLATIMGTGPNGRIVRADVEGAEGSAGLRQAQPERIADKRPASTVRAEPFDRAQDAPVEAQSSLSTPAAFETEIPHEREKLSNIRKTIARRLTEAKQQIPHIYLTVDVRLDALLKLRGEINATLEARGVKVSVNDMMVKALALALREVPSCNVSFTPTELIEYGRADIAVAVSTERGLFTPIVVGADAKAVSAIAQETHALATRAREGKLQPHEYQGGTASVSNMGMMGIREFAAVINPPQAMILAVGAGEKRAVVEGDALAIATMMTVTGSFDHRAIDGADGAQLLAAFKRLVEAPLGLVA